MKNYYRSILVGSILTTSFCLLSYALLFAAGGSPENIGKIAWVKANWQWILLGFYILEKLVKISPLKWDDLVVDAIKAGFNQWETANRGFGVLECIVGIALIISSAFYAFYGEGEPKPVNSAYEQCRAERAKQNTNILNGLEYDDGQCLKCHYD